MKPMTRALSLLMVLTFLVLGTSTALAAKSYSADRFDVDVRVQRDGSALVTETVTFRFEGGPFTFAFRKLPTRYTDGISAISVSEDGRQYAEGGKNAGQYTLDRNRNDIEVRWYFPATSDAVRTFTLNYRVAGLVRQENGQAAIRWGAIPPDHDYVIRDSRVSIHLPDDMRPLRSDLLVGTNYATSTNQGVVTYQARDIGKDDEMVVGVWAPLAEFTGVPPVWQVAAARQSAQDQANLPWGAGVAGLIGVLGLGGLFAAWRRVPALPPVSQDFPMYSAPDNLAPALAATLAKDSNGAGFGTLLDLAKRGIVQMREQPAQGGWGKKNTFEFVLRQPNASLAPFERVIVDAAFAKAKEPGIVALDDLGKGLSAASGRIGDTLKVSLRQMGLLDPSRERIRNQFYLAGGLLLLVALLVGIPSTVMFRVAGVLPMVVMILISIAAFIMGAALSVRTPEGERVAAAWLAFQTFLKRIADGKAPDAAQYLEAYLPYAAAFGMEEQWMKRYSNAGVSVPVWFSPVAGGNPTASWVAFSSAIHTSSSSAGAASGASAGAAGGGSSGAG